MEFIPRVNYVGNVFHFISNLACWHFSCRKWYNDFWIHESGDLTNRENDALIDAKALFLKYGFGANYWGKVFLRENDTVVWQKAKTAFKHDFSKFEGIFKTFEPRFQQFWKDDKNLLEQWASRIKVINFLLTPPGLIEDLDVFFGQKADPRTIEIFLQINVPGNSACGGSVIGPGAITLELSRTSFGFLRPVILVMWHELVHNIWQNNNYWKIIEDFTKEIKSPSPVKDVSWQELINETITESLFPHGYLAQKHFGFPSQEYFKKQLNTGNWRDLSAHGLFSLAKDYIESNKPLDINFFEEVVRVISQKHE